MIQSSKVEKILETLLVKIKEISEQNNIWADMSLFCQDHWRIDFQSLDLDSAIEFISFLNLTGMEGNTSLVINLGSLKTYNRFSDDRLKNFVFPVLRNIITSISSNTIEDNLILKEYIINLTTKNCSGCYMYEIEKIDKLIASNDIVKIHYY